MSAQDLKALYVFIESQLKANVSEDDMFTSIAEKTGDGIISALRTYRQFLKDTGRALTVEQRKEKVKKLVESHTVQEEGEEGEEGQLTVGDMNTLVVDVEKALDCSQATAISHVNKALTAMGIELPAKATVTGEVTQWLMSRPNVERKEFFEWVASTDRKSSTAAAYWANFLFAKKCHVAWSAPVTGTDTPSVGIPAPESTEAD